MNAMLEQRLAVLPELSPRLAEMKRRIRAGEHHHFRSAETVDVLAECEREGLDWTRRAARLTRRMCEAETVVIEPDERIVFTRTIRQIPPLYRSEELDRLRAGRAFHELEAWMILHRPEPGHQRQRHSKAQEGEEIGYPAYGLLVLARNEHEDECAH